LLNGALPPAVVLRPFESPKPFSTTARVVVKDRAPCNGDSNANLDPQQREKSYYDALRHRKRRKVADPEEHGHEENRNAGTDQSATPILTQ
jgi:hypothetical protein